MREMTKTENSVLTLYVKTTEREKRTTSRDSPVFGYFFEDFVIHLTFNGKHSTGLNNKFFYLTYMIGCDF